MPTARDYDPQKHRSSIRLKGYDYYQTGAQIMPDSIGGGKID
jgi:hypothetical protein